MSVTSAVILDTRRKVKNDKYPVKIRITENRKRRYYGLNIKITEDEWNKVNGEKPRDRLNSRKRKSSNCSIYKNN